MDANGKVLSVQGRMGLRSIASRLARRLLPSRRKASRSPDPSRSSGNDSSSTLNASSLGSKSVHSRPSLTPLRPPLISLLEVPPFGGKDPSFIPLLVYPLRACFESDTRILAMSKLDSASAAQLAEIIQAVCDIFHRIYTHSLTLDVYIVPRLTSTRNWDSSAVPPRTSAARLLHPLIAASAVPIRTSLL